MDVEKIRELIELMKDNELTEIRIVDGESRLLLKRGGQQPVFAPLPAAVAPAAAAPAPTAAAPAAMSPEPGEDAGLVAITSPMVGTFYAAPAPDADPYVSVGDRIKVGTVVCIIEAMKVMNEIKSEVAGTVEKILVDNTSPVEFGQPVFMVRPG